MLLVFTQKSNFMVTIYDSARFTSQADIKTDHCNAAINVEAEEPVLLALENNITTCVTKNLYAEQLGGNYEGISSGNTLYLFGNSAAKTISTTAKFTGDTVETIYAYGILCLSDIFIYSSDFLYTIKVTGSNSSNATVRGIYALGLHSEALFAKPITVQATSARYGCAAMGFGVQVNGDAKFYSGIAGDIKITAKAKKGGAHGCGIFVSSVLNIQEKLAGKITVSVSGNTNETDVTDQYTYACGIYTGENAEIHNISKGISVTSKNSGVAYATAIDVMSGIVSSASKELGIYGKNTAPVSVQATSTKSNAEASGLLAAEMYISQWSGNFKIAAKGNKAEAVIMIGAKSLSAGKLGGNFSVTATAKGESAISGGFTSDATMVFSDLSQLKLTVKAVSANGNAVASAFFSTEGGLFFDAADLSIGSVTVSAAGNKNSETEAAGFYMLKGTIGAAAACGNALEGVLKVTASNGTAYGIAAEKVDVASSIQMTVKGSSAAYAYYLSGEVDSGLRLTNCTVTAQVTNRKNKYNSYAVLLSEGDGTNIVGIVDGSKVTGNIDLKGGNDKVFVDSTSQFKGALCNVENIELEIGNNRKKFVWDIVESDSESAAKLSIDFDYGLTGEFAVCQKESDISWSDVIQTGIDLKIGNNTLQNAFYLGGGNYVDDAFFNFELEIKGNKMMLNVSEKLS